MTLLRWAWRLVRELLPVAAGALLYEAARGRAPWWLALATVSAVVWVRLMLWGPR